MPASPDPSGTGRATDTVRGGLHAMAVHWLGNAIAAGTITAGDQILPEDIGHQLGISRSVVREALRVLQSKGMITARPRTGTRILPVTEWNLLDPDVISWRVHGPDRDIQLRDLLDLREAVEPSAARGACGHADAASIDQLLGYCTEMEHAVRDGDHARFTAADIRFHGVLLDASGNLIYRQFAEPIGAVLHARHDLQLLPTRVEHVSVANHRAITDAITAGDTEHAETLTRQLITTARGEIFQTLGSADARQ